MWYATVGATFADGGGDNTVDMIRLHRDRPETVPLFPPTIERVRRMSTRYGGDGDSTAQTAWALFAGRQPQLGLWAGVEQGMVVGHMFATLQTWDGEYVGWVHQLESDQPLTQAAWDAGMTALRAWVGELNAAGQANGIVVRKLLMSTPHNPKVFERRGGWRVFRTLMEAKA